MMLSLFLTMALAIAPEDIEFDRVHVDWLAGFATVEQVLPESKLIPLKMIASKTYDKRQYGKCWIEELGDDGVDVILWGSLSRDLETATSCRRMLNQFYYCKECHGSGICVECNGERPRDYYGNIDYHYSCPKNCDYKGHCCKCDGAGDLRYIRSMVETYYERNFFIHERLQ